MQVGWFDSVVLHFALINYRFRYFLRINVYRDIIFVVVGSRVDDNATCVSIHTIKVLFRRVIWYNSVFILVLL